MKFTAWTRLSIVTISIVCVSSTSWAENNPFVGNWKLNPSKSKLTDVMKVGSVGDNKYAFNFGGDSHETITIDGTDQPGIFGTTLSVSVEGPNAWKVVRKKEGRILLIANWKLSDDGNALTDNYNGISRNGSVSTVNYVYQRRAGGPGFAGTWVSTSEAVNFVYVLQIRSYEGDGVSIVDSSSQLTKNLKFDGKDYPNVGENAAIIAASSLHRLDEHTLELTDKDRNGKVRDIQQIKLSSDLKTLTMTKHAAGRDEPDILVFERQ